MSQEKNINSCVNYSPSITRAPKQKITVDMYDDMQNDDILLKKGTGMVAQICNHCSSKNEAGRLLHANIAAYQLEEKTKQNKKQTTKENT